MISQRVRDALDPWLPPDRESDILKALCEVVDAAEKASAEIQSQHQMWPGEVDDLADALKELERAIEECE